MQRLDDFTLLFLRNRFILVEKTIKICMIDEDPRGMKFGSANSFFELFWSGVPVMSSLPLEMKVRTT